ncbi:MAG: nuclear transport factor 2 family protein [Ignavibacterium sp.]
MYAVFGRVQTTSNQSKDEIIAQIKILEALQTKAILESDTITLAKIWAEEYHVNNPSNMVVNRSQVFQRIKNTFIKYSTYTQEPEYYGVFDDVVIVMGKETVVPIGDNPDKDKILTRRYTDIYKMINGEWKGISRHANIVKD